MSKRALAWLAGIAATIALISIFAFDRSLAMAVHESGFENAGWVVQGRSALDIFTGRSLVGNLISFSDLLLGLSLIVIGVIWGLIRSASQAARGLIFTGIAQIATLESAWLIKEAFGRLRPFQLITSNGWEHMWFAGGNSFPSGHNAFFWGLFLPLAYIFPKYRIPLLIIPVFIAFARIDENYHFLSDVLSAIALAALVTLILAHLLHRWVRPIGATKRIWSQR